jgi:hypothetical protein
LLAAGADAGHHPGQVRLEQVEIQQQGGSRQIALSSHRLIMAIRKRLWRFSRIGWMIA